MLSLRKWEETLHKQVAGGNLLLGQLPLGQAPYNDKHMRELGRLLALRIAGTKNVYQRINQIEEKYPLSFALFLVLQGVYSYERGEYWPEPCHQLGIPYEGNFTAALGRTFRRILSRFRLPTFAHIKGQENLVPILAHGGIPNYSLGDFFRLLHSSVRDSLIQVDAETLIDQWTRTQEESFFWIDKPVERFVLHGGAVATDFVEQCITLVTASKPSVVTALALPQRVVDAYVEWQNRETNGHIAGPRIRLHRPVLYIDPYGEGVAIEFSSPFYPLRYGIESLQWEIVAGNHSFEVPTERRRVEEGYEYEASQSLQVPVASSYTVTLHSAEQVVRTWTLVGMDETQLLMFDPDTWNALPPDEYKRPGERWVLYPRSAKLFIDGDQLTKPFPPQYGEWSAYRVAEGIIPAAATLELHLPNQEPYRLNIADELSLRRPHLVDGNKPLNYHVNSHFPLYSGRPPCLRIAFPLKPDRTQLERWHISIRSEGASQPAGPISHSLAELNEYLIYEEDGSVLLKLDAPGLLGVQPMGKFEVHAQGPIGQSRRLGLRIVPHLKVMGDRQLYLDSPDTDAKLQLIGHPGLDICLLSHQDVVEFSSPSVAPNYYTLRAPSSVHTLKFVVDSRDGITVPFTIRLRRLRWALGEGSEDLVWQSSPLKIFPDALEDTYNAELYVELPPFSEDQQLYGGWRLVDGSNRIYTLRQPDEERSRRQYAIPLAELMAEYRHSREQGETLRLQLWVTERTDRDAAYFVDALFLLPSFKLDEVHYKWEQRDKGVYLTLSWEGMVQGKNRVLFLWLADKPWLEEPREIPIPDENLHSCRLFIPHIFGSSDYRGCILAAIDVKSPWVSQAPARPAVDQSNAFIICPPYANQYYAELQEAFRTDSASSEQMLVLMHYYHRNGNKDRMHRINIQLRNAAKQEQLPLEQLVLWAELTERLDKTAYKLVQQYTLFNVEMIDMLSRSHLSEIWRQRYFAHLTGDFAQQADIYEYLLIAGFTEVRDLCIAALCRQGRRTGVEELLSDVEDGRLLVRDAVEQLLPAMEKLAPLLVQIGTEDASTLLRLLAARATSPIRWLQPGYWLETDIGEGEVQTLIASDTGRAVACCDLNDSVLVEVGSNQTAGSPPFMLDLGAKLAMVKADPVYQCVCCRRVFESHEHVVRHHRENHPHESNIHFRRLTGRNTIMAANNFSVQYR